jgi:hypothetical protein
MLIRLRQRLAAVGLSPCAVNLTRADIDVPVVRTFCAGLEPGLRSPPGPRLTAAAAASGADPINHVPF